MFRLAQVAYCVDRMDAGDDFELEPGPKPGVEIIILKSPPPNGTVRIVCLNFEPLLDERD